MTLAVSCCGFLCASLDDIVFFGMGSILKGNLAPRGANSFLKQPTPTEKGGINENDRPAPPMKVYHLSKKHTPIPGALTNSSHTLVLGRGGGGVGHVAAFDQSYQQIHVRCVIRRC